MGRRFLSSLLLLIAVGLGAGAAVLRSPPATRADETVELAPGVYFRHGNLESSGHCNNGVVLFADFAFVIDANFPSGAEAVIRSVRELTDKPLRFVFDTHHHGDHAYGNPVWRRNGALPVAHENVVAELARLEPQRWQDAARSRKDVADLGLPTAMPPVITYPDRMVFDDGARRVELLHFGTAHTRGDGFAYLPKEKILFTGDAVVNGPYNYMGDGDTGSWLEVLDHLAQLDVEIVVPGHGACADKELISLQREYIATLRKAVKEGIDAGKDLAAIRRSVTVPEKLRRYVGTMLDDQIAKIHAELAKG